MCFRDTGHFPFYFQGYGILSILLPGYRILFSIFLFTSRNLSITTGSLLLISLRLNMFFKGYPLEAKTAPKN